VEIRCPACNRDRIVEGRLCGNEGTDPTFDLPPQEEGFFRTFGPRVQIVERMAHLCLDCGLLWTQVDKDTAIEEIARRGNDELLDKVHIAKRPKRKWRWLLFGSR
jgi:hypothetical protein